MIEKHIHQIWLQGKDHVPQKFKINQESILKYHPHWTYTLWDEPSILRVMTQNESTSKEWTTTYNTFTYMHQKIDFAKYILVYVYGGVYLDIDVESIQCLDSLLLKFPAAEVIVSLSVSNNIESFFTIMHHRIINNGILFGKQNSDILRELITTICNRDKCPSWLYKVLCITTTTGPRIFTTFFEQYVDDDRVVILQPHFLEPCRGQHNCTINAQTYTLHKHEYSWIPFHLQHVMNWYVKHENKQKMFLLIIIILLVFFIVFLVFYSYRRRK